MNRKGQMNGVGYILIVALTLIVGVVLFQVVAQEVGKSTNTVAIANDTLSGTVNGTIEYMTDYRALSGVVIYNATNSVIVPSSNYTVTNNVVYNGALAVSVEPLDTLDRKYLDFDWSISGTAQPLTYIPSSGGRAVAGLISIFFALAILVVALEPSLRNKFLEAIGR